MIVRRGESGAAVIFLGLAHDDEHALAQIGRVAGDRRRAQAPVVEFALADLDERDAVTEREQIAFVNDAHVVIAAHRAALAPLFDGQRIGRFPHAARIDPRAHRAEHQSLDIYRVRFVRLASRPPDRGQNDRVIRRQMDEVVTIVSVERHAEWIVRMRRW